MTTPWTALLDGLPAISLAELDADAALLTRVDRKYLVTPAQWAEVAAGLEGARALEIDGRRTFRYTSVYFDTPELASYRAAAHRRPARYKVRTREYRDTGAMAIEVKLRSARGETVKHRRFLEPHVRVEHRLDGEPLEFVGSFPAIGEAARALTATLTTEYSRSTLWTPGGRVTVDTDVTGADPYGGVARFGDRCIVETKSTGRVSATDRALWAHGHRPQRVSKYATTLAALNPHLPSNRWARTLSRHLRPADEIVPMKGS